MMNGDDIDSINHLTITV